MRCVKSIIKTIINSKYAVPSYLLPCPEQTDNRLNIATILSTLYNSIQIARSLCVPKVRMFLKLKRYTVL